MMPLSVNGKMASVYRTLKIPNIYHTTDGGCAFYVFMQINNGLFS